MSNSGSQHTMLSFTQKVYHIVRKIPKGEVLTYKQVAQKAGNSLASRAVGSILRKNYDPEIPCHRVVRSDGALGGYNRGGALKKGMLIKEGFLNSQGEHNNFNI